MGGVDRAAAARSCGAGASRTATASPYWPLAEILKGHAGILDSDPPELAVEKVRKTGRDLLTQEVATDPAQSTAALALHGGTRGPGGVLRARRPA